MERNQRSGEIAKALGVSAASIQAYARAGRIPYRKTPGEQYRFNLEEVREVLGLADITTRRDLVSVFSDDTVLGVDALSAFRDDPMDATALRQARIRGVHSRRAVSAAPSTADAGAAQLAHLVKTGHGASVAVVRREHVDA
jgi:excisionase family DNA binding protein